MLEILPVFIQKISRVTWYWKYTGGFFHKKKYDAECS
jgi:hypothetical protein